MNNLETDFCNGRLTFAMAAGLLHLLKHFSRNRFLADQLANIEKDDILARNIGKDDMLARNSKLILGLVWQLICHYSTFGDLVNIGKHSAAAEDTQIHAFTNWCSK